MFNVLLSRHIMNTLQYNAVLQSITTNYGLKITIELLCDKQTDHEEDFLQERICFGAD